MTGKDIEKLLIEVRNGSKSVEEALEILKSFPYADLGFARIDHHREIRTGYPEIIYCAGKTIEQVRDIFRAMADRENNIMGTRATIEMYDSVKSACPGAVYYKEARIISLQKKMPEMPETRIAVITAGTSDIPVAEEAAVTAQEVFILADQALKAVVDQIRDDQWELVVPDDMTRTPGSTLRETINYHAYDDAWVPDVLAGRTIEEVGDKYDGDLLGDHQRLNFASIAETAMLAKFSFGWSPRRSPSYLSPTSSIVSPASTCGTQASS